MWRDVEYDPRSDDRDRPDASRSGTAGADLSDGRGRDPRDVFARDLDLPRGRARERVYRHGRTYALHGGEVRTLATVGAFRVVPDVDLRDRPESRPRDLRHLQELGLVRTVPYVIGKTRTKLVTLTDRGRDVLEDARRGSDRDTGQAFYAGVSKPRELAHDAHLYRAYTKAADRLVARGASIRRVVLEEALKREYQQFLQASNRRRPHSDGRPDRSADEIAEWARAHQLPLLNDHVQFPDVRIEYDDRDGRRAIEDLEVLTPHYRGAHAAAKGQAGFTCYRAVGARLGGAGGSSRSGGRGFDPRVAEEMLG
jgi:hypothetical protein